MMHPTISRLIFAASLWKSDCEPTQKRDTPMAAQPKFGPLLFGIAVASLMSGAAGANDLPVNVPEKAAASSVGNFYVWAEGPWGPVRSPSGAAPTLRNNSNHEIQSSMPPSGWDTLNVFGPPAADSVRGGVGYVFPEGTFPSTFGSKARVEFGASQTSTSVGGMQGNHNALIGAPGGGVALGGCAGCSGSVSTAYTGTRTSVKAASDYNVNGVTVTPSVTVFSGSNQQDFTATGPGDPSGTLRWKDTGTTAGLDAKVNLAPALTLNVGGNLGVGSREASLTSGVPDGAINQRSAASVTGKAEAKLTYKPLDDLELKGFAGMRNFDSALPGISVSSGSSPQIKYGSEAGYYVGAGATFRFQSKD
jgi:hypothetical protein